MKWKVILKSHKTHGDSNKKWFFCFCFTEKEVGLDESVMGDPRALGLWPLIKSCWSGRKLSLVTLFVSSLIQSKQQIWFLSHLILLLCGVLASSNFHWWRRADIFLVRAHQSETESWAAPDSWHCVGPFLKETQWTAVALIRSECRKVARPLIAWGVTKIWKLFWPHN